MVHLKTILDTRRLKSDGTYPITFRITHVKQVKYFAVGISVKQLAWNEENQNIKKTHPNAQVLNAVISKKYYEFQKAIIQLESNGGFSFEALKNMLNPPQVVDNYKVSKTIKLFTTELINGLIAVNRTGNAIVYQTALNRLIAFSKNDDLTFEQLDYQLLEKFKQHLLIDGKKVNTIGNYFRSLRAIYNKAIKEKIIDRSYYPFTEITIKVERTAKRAVKKDDITKLELLDVKPYSQEWHSLNYFLLSFYLIGMSFTDMAYLTSDNIANGRIEYRRRKTHKLYSVKLSLKAEAILDLYKRGSNKYLLPVLNTSVIENSLQAKKLIYQWIKTTNKYLSRLQDELSMDHKLTTYVARHSFATIAKRLGYSNELIAEAMGHEYGNKVTNIYLDAFDKDVVDKMHLIVISGI